MSLETRRFITGTSENEIGKWLGGWFQEHSGYNLFSPYSAIGIHDGTKLQGVAIFCDYTGSSMELHVHLARGCITRKALRYMFNYIFNELGCNILRAKPKHKNELVIDLLERLGFEYEATLERYYSAEDHAVCFKLTKERAAQAYYHSGNALPMIVSQIGPSQK